MPDVMRASLWRIAVGCALAVGFALADWSVKAERLSACEGRAVCLSNGDELDGRAIAAVSRDGIWGSVVRHGRSRAYGALALVVSGLLLVQGGRRGWSATLLLTPILGGMLGNGCEILAFGWGTDVFHLGLVAPWTGVPQAAGYRLISYNLADVLIVGGLALEGLVGSLFTDGLFRGGRS